MVGAGCSLRTSSNPSCRRGSARSRSRRLAELVLGVQALGPCDKGLAGADLGRSVANSPRYKLTGPWGSNDNGVRVGVQGAVVGHQADTLGQRLSHHDVVKRAAVMVPQGAYRQTVVSGDRQFKVARI